MKRFLLLFVLIGLMAACSLPEAAQDTTASIQQGTAKDEVITRVNEVECGGFFNHEKGYGVVSFQYEVAEDSLKLGWEEPDPIFGSGFIHPAKAEDLPLQSTFDCNDPAWRNFMLGGQEGEPFIIFNGPLESGFFANLVGIRVPYPMAEEEQRDSFLLEVSGVVINPADANFLAGFKAENAKEDLIEFECYGQFIPDSTIFNIIMIGEGSLGQLIYITGVAAQEGLKPVSEATSFECDGSGQILLNLETETPSFLLENVGLRPTNGEGGEIIIFEATAGVGMRIEH